MRVVHHLADLPSAPVRAVIINCGTRWVTSLALVSTLRNTDNPVLLIDCGSEDGSEAHFRALARRLALDFDWLSWPLAERMWMPLVLLRTALVKEALSSGATFRARMTARPSVLLSY
jgi:hypothetical protein